LRSCRGREAGHRRKIEELERRQDLKAAKRRPSYCAGGPATNSISGFSFAPIDLRRSDAVKFTIDEGRFKAALYGHQRLGEAAARDIAAQRT
jgi:DNA polymerase III alpha subunit (gram-positive type)